MKGVKRVNKNVKNNGYLPEVLVQAWADWYCQAALAALALALASAANNTMINNRIKQNDKE